MNYKKLVSQYPIAKGSARLFDFSGTLDSRTKHYLTNRTVTAALKSDWTMLSFDFKRALHEFKKTYGRKTKKK